MKQLIFSAIFLVLLSNATISAQHNNLEQPLSINDDGSAPDSSAILDLKTENKGLLIPRMNLVARNLIQSPALGLLIYQTDSMAGFYYFDGGNWSPLKAEMSADNDSTNELNNSVSLNGTNLEITDAGGVVSTDLSGFQDSTWKEGPDAVYNVTSAIGIGTQSPSALLEISQDAASPHVKDTAVFINQNSPSSYCLYVQNNSKDTGPSYGIYSKTASNFNGGSRHGIYNTMTPADTDTSSYYGFRSYINEGGSSSGTRYGVYSTVEAGSASSSPLYGLRSSISGGTGNRYGVYSSIASGSGDNYGVYAAISGSSGTQYGIYADANGSSNYAGYFLGRGYFSQNVGIHKVSHSSKSSLHVKQVTSNEAIRIEHHSNTNYWNVGLGTTTQNYRFEFNGTGRAQIDDATGAYSTISDFNLKTNIEPMENVLDKVLDLKPAVYHYKDATDREKSRGFIAQEVAEIFPELVRMMDVNDAEAAPISVLAYDDFAVLAIKAIQEQQELIDNLELKMASQNQVITSLQSQAEEIESLKLVIEHIQKQLVENE